jgi:hypothetical protein
MISASAATARCVFPTPHDPMSSSPRPSLVNGQASMNSCTRRFAATSTGEFLS